MPEKPHAMTWFKSLLKRLIPNTIQLCVHCKTNPAGFWVYADGVGTVRRPWCFSCICNSPTKLNAVHFNS